MRPAVTALVATAGAAAAVGAFALLRPSKKTTKARRCPALGPKGGELSGVVYEEGVTAGADPSARLPMVIAFHGKAAKPFGIREILERGLVGPARIIAPRGILQVGEGSNWQWWPLFSTTEKSEQFDKDVLAAKKMLAPFVREIARCRPTKGRPVLAGHSQGGMMALALSSSGASRVVASSAWLPLDMFGSKMAKTSFVHGTKDEQVPYGRTAKLVADLERKGRPVSLVSVDAGHALDGELEDTWLTLVEAGVV